ncbi:hypothetical protein [Micromonospora sp. NPDC048063]|uniref:hypothetical protein n=1 Tax=Micromonospora sp. NPDC048063 TaxID=3364256 RepID=UPI003717B584
MWIPVGDNRWDWTADADRHLLVLDGDAGMFGELHGQYLHRYRAPEQVDQEWPLTDAQHIDTALLDEPVESDEQAWQVLADAVAVTG